VKKPNTNVMIARVTSLSLAGLALGIAASVASGAPQYSIIYQFPGGVHGINPEAGVILGSDGSVFGTTDSDGIDAGGVVFQLAAPVPGLQLWTQTILRRFHDGTDGGYPLGLLLAPSGSLFGVTLDEGGTSNGAGTVFSLTPPASVSTNWTFATLYRFRGNYDGSSPSGSLISDAAGTLSGTTILGGAGPGLDGYGTAFSLSPPAAGSSGWTETVLHRFKSSPDGATPAGTLLAGDGSVKFGVSTTGGTGICSDVGCGTAYRLAQSENGWTETIIYQFQGGTDGAVPVDRLVADTNGSLYGATAEGGLPGPGGHYATGTVFRLDPPASGGVQWTKTILYEFHGGNDGSSPEGGVTLDTSGAIYGTTEFDGTHSHGTVFKLTPNAPGQLWTKTTLHNFGTNTNDGADPTGPLTRDTNGVLYGTTLFGGRSNFGTVYRITP
jgi:uncharacterized repeat protein (TIGR03803 family)